MFYGFGTQSDHAEALRDNKQRAIPGFRALWRVYEIASKGRYIGSVMAADDKAAIQKIIDEYKITEPHRQRRLVAQRES